MVGAVVSKRRGSGWRGKSCAGLLAMALVALGGCIDPFIDVHPTFGSHEKKADPVKEQAARELGKQHFTAGRYGQAVKYYASAVERNPASVEALNGLAASYDLLGRHDLAERYYRQALTLDPHSAQTLNNLGYSYHLQGKFDVALAYLTEASAADSAGRQVHANYRMASAALAEAIGSSNNGATASSVAKEKTEKPSDRSNSPRIERTTPTVQKLYTQLEPPITGPIADVLRDDGRHQDETVAMLDPKTDGGSAMSALSDLDSGLDSGLGSGLPRGARTTGRVGERTMPTVDEETQETSNGQIAHRRAPIRTWHAPDYGSGMMIESGTELFEFENLMFNPFGSKTDDLAT